MNTELNDLLNSGEFSGKQLGRIFILDDIDALNHNSERHQKFTPSVTTEELAKLIEGLQKTPEGLRVLNVYKKLSISLYSIYNYSQTVIQQAQNGFFRLLGQSQSILNSTETARLLSKFPMAITQKELEATRKKSTASARKEQISIAQALLGEIRLFYDQREKCQKAQEAKEALETPVTDSYLCGLRCNQDIISEGGVHFGIKSAGEKTKEALVTEVMKTFLKERHLGQSIERLSEFIYQQASVLFSEAFKNPQAFLSRFPEGSISPSDMRDVIRALWYSIACSFFDEGYTTKEIIQSNLETLFEEYIGLVIPFARFNKPSVEKMVLEEIFQCAPLKYHYAPYKDGLRLCDIVEAPEERTGGTQEGFNALLRYADRLEPLLTGKAGETLLKTLKDPKTTAKAYSTMSTVGELADKLCPYGFFLLGFASTEGPILEQFRKSHPKDPRACFNCSRYQVWEYPIEDALEEYERASQNEIDRLYLSSVIGERITDVTVNTMAYACRVLLCSKALLIRLADIYEVPELAKAQIKEWPVMEQNLKVLNFNILSILRATKEGNRLLEGKRIQAVLKVFVPIEKKDLEPSKADINALLAKVRKDPFSEDAEKTLSYLTESIQEYASKFGFKTKGNRSKQGK